MFDVSPETLERLLIPRYSYAEADRLANVSRGTAKRWLTGYVYVAAHGERVQLPPVTKRARAAAQDGVSFLDLVELAGIGRLKKIGGFDLPRIRQIILNSQKQFGVDHPLAYLRFKIGGRDAFVETADRLVDVLRHKGRQAWSEVLSPFLDTLDYIDNTVAYRWWPDGKDNVVVVDPEYGYGLPVIAGSGVRTELVLERFNAGENREQIAEDFSISPEEVDHALRFETRLLAA